MGKIDLSYLENITGGEKGIIIEMLDLILTETPKHIAKIKNAHREKEWSVLGAEAHKLKPMFLYVGLTQLNEAAQGLEKCGKEGTELEMIPSLVETIDEGFNEAITDIEAAKAKLS